MSVLETVAARLLRASQDAGRRDAPSRKADSLEAKRKSSKHSDKKKRKKAKVDTRSIVTQTTMSFAKDGTVQAPSLTPPSSIPQQTKVESGEPKATSGPGGEIFSVSAIF